jgi:acyl-coenzyme A thioesterase PaaI-like protein
MKDIPIITTQGSIAMNALAMYNKISKLPAGNWIFSKAVCLVAPYFGSIKPRFDDLRPNYCQISIKKRRRVHNHIGTVHAIAMCNMAELAGGTMTDVSVPKKARWIPAGMTVQYVKKAKTDLIAVADGTGLDWSVNGDVIVPVIVKDTAGETVFTADITMNVKQG